MCALSGSGSWALLSKEFRCRQCGSDAGYESRPRNALEKFLLPVLGLRPARCGDCYRRSWRRMSVQLLPRKGPTHFDAEAMLASARPADSGEAHKETPPHPKDCKRIA